MPRLCAPAVNACPVCGALHGERSNARPRRKRQLCRSGPATRLPRGSSVASMSHKSIEQRSSTALSVSQHLLQLGPVPASLLQSRWSAQNSCTGKGSNSKQGLSARQANNGIPPPAPLRRGGSKAQRCGPAHHFLCSSRAIHSWRSASRARRQASLSVAPAAGGCRDARSLNVMQNAGAAHAATPRLPPPPSRKPPPHTHPTSRPRRPYRPCPASSSFWRRWRSGLGAPRPAKSCASPS